MRVGGKAAAIAIAACTLFALIWTAAPGVSQVPEATTAAVTVANAPEVRAYTQSKTVHLLRAGQTIRGTMVLGPMDVRGFKEVRIVMPDISAAVDVAFESPDKKYAIVGSAVVPWGQTQGQAPTFGNYLVVPVLGNKCWVTLRVSSSALPRLTAPQGIWAYLVN